jgi:hypothetical protein
MLNMLFKIAFFPQSHSDFHYLKTANRQVDRRQVEGKISLDCLYHTSKLDTAKKKFGAKGISH